MEFAARFAASTFPRSLHVSPLPHGFAAWFAHESSDDGPPPVFPCGSLACSHLNCAVSPRTRGSSGRMSLFTWAAGRLIPFRTLCGAVSSSVSRLWSLRPPRPFGWQPAPGAGPWVGYPHLWVPPTKGPRPRAPRRYRRLKRHRRGGRGLRLGLVRVRLSGRGQLFRVRLRGALQDQPYLLRGRGARAIAPYGFLAGAVVASDKRTSWGARNAWSQSLERGRRLVCVRLSALEDLSMWHRRLCRVVKWHRKLSCPSWHRKLSSGIADLFVSV